MAEWSGAFINGLPDSSFLYIESGGKKDAEGKTTPRSLRHFPVKDASGKVDMPHLRNALSRIPQSSLPQSVKDACVTKAQAMMKSAGGGRDDDLTGLVRASARDYEVREGEGVAPMLTGYLARWDEWAEINSAVEGHFLERIDPGAFTKTVRENRDRFKVLFQHGMDPTFGKKPLGPIRNLEADDEGLRYEVELLRTSYNDDLIEMLRSDPPVLGTSFRFDPILTDVNRKPARSGYNPKALPEVTRREVRMIEFGPVTFPAYAGAKVALRSMTDEFMVPQAVVRYDSEDVSLISQMISIGGWFLECQDEDDDPAAAAAMKDVLSSLHGLMGDEMQEDEAAEPGEAGDAGRSTDEPDPAEVEEAAPAPPAEEAATPGTSERTVAQNGHARSLVGRRAPQPIALKKGDVPRWHL